MRTHEILPSLLKALAKLSKKNKPLYEQVIKKIEEVAGTPDIEHYKNLQYDMKDSKRVHIGHFVLVFEYRKKEDKIIFKDFDHHDNIYTK
ncbi:MAG TPA: type II toxin-antitoxin system RelE/ParE family toxin [archaeon]|nr:type II toxin-antitoxin system RelE/ParE family toxin [archaeon]